MDRRLAAGSYGRFGRMSSSTGSACGRFRCTDEFVGAVMSVREIIENQRNIVLVVALAAIAGARIPHISKVASAVRNITDAELREAYYTIDDGTTWFVDDAQKIPPFDHNGKTAYRRANVCRGEREVVSGYLERYTRRAQKANRGSPARRQQRAGRACRRAGRCSL